ncbi:MAG TPA: DUF4087 domain-containing protein [Pyrinomonadaceae bacterium]
MRERLIKSRLIVFCCLLSAAVISAGGYPHAAAKPDAAQFETRCGWFDNPTPANVSLYDREGQWVIGSQGGHQLEDLWERPKFTPRQWVATNGHYGYGCACLRLRVDKETGRVLEARAGRARPLTVCRRDRALKRWKRLFK